MTRLCKIKGVKFSVTNDPNKEKPIKKQNYNTCKSQMLSAL